MDKLEVLNLNGTDLDCLHAFTNAVRANSFTTFAEHFKEQLPSYFKKCFVNTSEGTKDLSIVYKNMPLGEVKEFFDEVYKKRKEELTFLFKEYDVSYNNLSDLQQIKYQLLYLFGDKIGGYPAIAALGVEETLNLYSIFTELNKKEIDSLKNNSKETKK